MEPNITKTENISSFCNIAVGDSITHDLNQLEIKPEQWDLPVPWFSISTRLAHLLQTVGIERLGDLSGRTFLEFWKYPNCGRKTIEELRHLLSQAQTTSQSAEDDHLEVPPSLHERSPYDFSPPRRVTRLLRKYGISRLGELRQITPNELRSATRYKAETLTELSRFLDRVRQSESVVRLTRFMPSEIAGLLRALAEAIGTLPTEKRRMTELRLGGGIDGPVWPVHDIGRELNLSESYVSISLHRNWKAIRRAVGLDRRAQLERLAGWCCERVVPLTPDLLCSWLDRQENYSVPRLQFFARLIGKLEPGVPAWPQSSEHQKPDRRQGKILKAVRPLVKREAAGLSCKEAYERLTGREDMRELTVVEFLGALERGRIVTVRFLAPDRPQIHWRWAL